jgi:hypothetical protein
MKEAKMSKSIVRAVCGLLILLVVVVGLAACGSMAEPDYANEITESALVSMSECDYAAHMALYTPNAQAAITEADFDTRCQAIKAIIGDYIDKEFWKARTQNSYTVVDYKANFSDEPDGVTITVYFEGIEGEMHIAGFWLDSPKLLESLEAAAAGE